MSFHAHRRTYTQVAVALGLALAVPVATAHAVPSPQTPQGQTSPQTPGGQSSPQTPETPAPAAPAAPYVPPQRIAPAPPQTNNWQTVPEANYPRAYSPEIETPSVPQAEVPEIARIAPEPETLRLGNVVIAEKDIPNIPDKQAWIGSGNEWFAYAEQQIATNLTRLGVPEDEATRRASAAVIGLVAGGAVGGAVVFTATALVVGPVVIPLTTLIGTGIGAGVGTVVPTIAPGLNTLTGAGVGAAAGAATGVAITFFSAALAGLAAGTVTAVVGAAVAYALGAGDPGADVDRPSLPWDPAPRQGPEIANPEADQFTVTLTPDEAVKAGLPGVEVEYKVNTTGDVSIDGSVLGHNINVGWTQEQASAPLEALGAVAPQAKQVINDGVRGAVDVIRPHVPGLDIAWPQESPDTNTTPGKHRTQP